MDDRATALKKLESKSPIAWENEGKLPALEALEGAPANFSLIVDAAARFIRFEPYLAERYPETDDGRIDSPVTFAPELRASLSETYRLELPELALKRDNELPIARSIKARGGIHEILTLAESLAMRSGLFEPGEDYRRFADDEFTSFFSRYKVSVGSTGNLGMSVGLTAAGFGFETVVHMSRDAKKWKKDLLREGGAEVIEHDDSYSAAVAEGRKASLDDPDSFFVDDERSPLLFSGYGAAIFSLRNQLREVGIHPDEGERRARVYVPCGVGGAPSGILYALKSVYGDKIDCWIIEPTGAPAMLAALLTDDPQTDIERFGLDGITEADGLAVGRASELAWRISRHLLDGAMTVEEDRLFELLALAWKTEKVKIEPSAAAALNGPITLEPLPGETAIAWLTGGSAIPDEIFQTMLERGAESLAEKRQDAGLN